MLRGLDLHFEIPAISQFRHCKLLKRAASDCPERTHVRVTHALENAQQQSYESPCKNLAGEHGSGLAIAAQTRANDEVLFASGDGRNQPLKPADFIRSVAVHVDENVCPR